MLAHARGQARDDLIGVRCDKVRNREARTRYRFRRLIRRGSDDWRGKRDAVTCGWEDVCAISACVVFRFLEEQSGSGVGGGEGRRTIAESLEHVADVESQSAVDGRSG